MGRLDGKVALITGAAGGIGRVAAELFASEGAKVVVADVLDADGEAAVEKIRAVGGEAHFVHADVSNATDCEAMIEAEVGRFGSLDILYNNAGIFPGDDGSVTETSEATWDRVMNINLKGVFLGCKEQRRRARADPGSGGRVRPAGGQGKRALPGADRHADAGGAAFGSRSATATDRAHPGGTARPRRGDRSPRCSLHPGSRRTSRGPPSWWTAASPPRTRRRSD